jgi:hypothetical protein
MRSCIRIFVCFLALNWAASAAAIVRFYTFGVFDSTGSDTANYGNLSLVFEGVGDIQEAAPAEVLADPVTFTSFGAIAAAIPQTAPTAALSDTFSVFIVQQDPSSGTGSLTGSLSGTVSYAASTGLITFSARPLTLGSVRYSFALPLDPVVQPSTGGGVQTIEGRVEEIPEPSAFFPLTLIAAAGVFLMKRKGRFA